MFLKVTSGLPRVFRCMSSECSEVKEMAATIVRDYLTGHWKMANSSNVTVKKLNGGLSNWLYQITMAPFQNQNDNLDPKTVLLRIHGPNYGKFAVDQIVTDSLVFMLMSERKLGPKLHGVFPGGRIEEYVPARPLKTSELSNPKISSAIAAKVAHIHSLNVPISKNPDSLYDLMFQWLSELQKNRDDYKSENPDLLDRFNSYDLFAEVNWLKQYLKKFNSVVVFSHNDLQEGNILITYDSVNTDEPHLVLIDYEYCSYNYRGFELANHFLEYTMNYKAKEHPYFTVDMSAYPTIEQQVKFIRKYLKVYNDLRQNGNTEEVNDSYEYNDTYTSSNLEVTREECRVLDEVSNFRLLSHLLWGIWAATHSQSGIEFGYWEYCIARLNAYYETKEEILASEFSKVKKIF